MITCPSARHGASFHSGLSAHNFPGHGLLRRRRLHGSGCSIGGVAHRYESIGGVGHTANKRRALLSRIRRPARGASREGTMGFAMRIAGLFFVSAGDLAPKPGSTD